MNYTFLEPRMEEITGDAEAAARSGMGTKLDEGDLELEGRYDPRSRGEVSEWKGRRDCEGLLRRLLVRIRVLDRVRRRVAMIDPQRERSKERRERMREREKERES